MSPLPETWIEGATERVRTVWGGPHWAPWDHGLWVSARERYHPVPLPEGFEVEVVELAGVRRRVARIEGEGRAVVVVPGLYAGLHEHLFVAIAARLAELGRPVLLLEDRLAEGTVALSGLPSDDADPGGLELAALCLGERLPPDVLALSAGLVPAWAAPPGAFRRVAGFSGVRDPARTVAEVRRRLWVRRHFAACHERAGLAGRIGFDALLDRFARIPPLAPPAAEWLLVHAVDDPVVPVEGLDDLPPERVVRLADGGHLGFGVCSGVDVYAIPFPGDAHA